MVRQVRHILFRIPAEVLISVGVHAVLLVALILFVALPAGPQTEEQTAVVRSVEQSMPPLPEPPPPEPVMPLEPEPEPEPVPQDTPPELPEVFEEPTRPSLDPSDILPKSDLRDICKLQPDKSVIGVGGGRAGRTSAMPPPLPPPPPPKLKPPPPPTRATPTTKPPPEYPSRAVLRELEGRVVLLVEVLPTGEVGRIDVKESSGYAILDRAAITAVGEWHFRPAFAQGQPVRSMVEVPFSFKLKE